MVSGLSNTKVKFFCSKTLLKLRKSLPFGQSCFKGRNSIDKASAETHISRVKHGALPRGCRPLRIGKREAHGASSRICGGNDAAAVRRPVAGFHRYGVSGQRRFSRHPAAVHGGQRPCEKPRIIVPLHDDERIGLEILAGNKPGFAVTVAAGARRYRGPCAARACKKRGPCACRRCVRQAS